MQTVLKSAPERVKELFVHRGRQDDRLKKIHNLAEQHGVTLQWVSSKWLDAKVDGRHQGVVAHCVEGRSLDESFLYELVENAVAAPFFLMLDGVTDPHNLGACLRSAEGAGVDAVIVPKDNSAGVTAVVRKVACGAAEVVPLVVVTNLSRTLQRMKDLGVWVVGTTGDASTPIYDMKLRDPLVLVMGSEESGLRQLTRKHCDFLAKIPMRGSISSLNISVAAGVSLFEVVRQRMG